MPAFRSILSSLTLFALTLAAHAADPLTGVVTNGTTHKPAAGDTVTLIRLQQGMQEASHTTTDAHGRFTLDVPDDGVHLVRVTHDKAAYFRPAPPGTQSVEIEVFNAAAKVKGVATEADVMRLQTDASGKSLQVVEHFFVKNDSAPPMTQFSEQPFDFWLPEGAVIAGSAALAPGGMPVQAAPVPLAEKNHYTFLFPIRPGETQFQITYSLPYSGTLTLSPRVASTTDTVAIMLPKSMTFTTASSASYNAVTDEPTAQTYVARNVSPDQAIAFTLSGAGQLPRDTDANGSSSTQQSSDSGQPIPETENKMPGKGLQNPLDPEGTRDPWAKYKWYILGGLALLLAAAAGVLLRKPAVPATLDPAPAAPVPNPQVLLLQSLKEELFSLETDRLQNRISEAEYLEQKAALETVLRRALSRNTTTA